MNFLYVKMIHNTVVYNVSSILHCQSRVYFGIYELFHILLPLWHTYGSMIC